MDQFGITSQISLIVLLFAVKQYHVKCQHVCQVNSGHEKVSENSKPDVF